MSLSSAHSRLCFVAQVLIPPLLPSSLTFGGGCIACCDGGRNKCGEANRRLNGYSYSIADDHDSKKEEPRGVSSQSTTEMASVLCLLILNYSRIAVS